MDKRRKYNNAKNFTWHFSQTLGQKLQKNYFSSWHLLKGWYHQTLDPHYHKLAASLCCLGHHLQQ